MEQRGELATSQGIPTFFRNWKRLGRDAPPETLQRVQLCLSQTVGQQPSLLQIHPFVFKYNKLSQFCFMCTGVMSSCMSVYHMHACWLKRPEEGNGSPGTPSLQLSSSLCPTGIAQAIRWISTLLTEFLHFPPQWQTLPCPTSTYLQCVCLSPLFILHILAKALLSQGANLTPTHTK